MWATIKNYKNQKAVGNADAPVQFTKEDAFEVLNNHGDGVGQCARRKLFSATAENNDCFHLLQKELRSRRVTTNTAVAQILKQDIELWRSLCAEVQERGVSVPASKDSPYGMLEAKQRENVGFLSSLKGLVGNIGNNSNEYGGDDARVTGKLGRQTRRRSTASTLRGSLYREDSMRSQLSSSTAGLSNLGDSWLHSSVLGEALSSTGFDRESSTEAPYADINLRRESLLEREMSWRNGNDSSNDGWPEIVAWEEERKKAICTTGMRSARKQQPVSRSLPPKPSDDVGTRIFSDKKASSKDGSASGPRNQRRRSTSGASVRAIVDTSTDLLESFPTRKQPKKQNSNSIGSLVAKGA